MLKYSLPTTAADVLAGPGIVGLMAALGGASRVVKNGARLPAEDDAILNLEASLSILGIEKTERLGENKLSL